MTKMKSDCTVVYKYNTDVTQKALSEHIQSRVIGKNLK